MLRTFGSPFKINRVRNPRRNAEETLESQTGPFQSGSKEEAELTYAPQHNSALLAKPISNLPQEVGTAKDIPPSKASTRSAAKVQSDDYRQSPPASPDGRNGLQLTEGSSRIVMANDGTKDCMALLVSEELIRELNYITEETRKLEIAERKLSKATRDARNAEREAQAIEAEVAEAESTKNPELVKDLLESIETQTKIFDEKTARKGSLSSLVFIHRQNLKHGQNVFQDIFRNALRGIELPSLPTNEIENLGPSVAVEDDQESIAESETDESIVSVDKLFRRNASHDIMTAGYALRQRRAQFDNRQNDYESELERFQFARANGTTSCTQTLFDCLAFEGVQQLTRALINAEADQESVLERARALGILQNEYDQESNFISDISDGYHESEEASLQAAVDRTFIRSWTDNIVHSPPEELEELQELEEGQEPDEWEAKTIGISDSISVVDYSRNRERIDRWREFCGI